MSIGISALSNVAVKNDTSKKPVSCNIRNNRYGEKRLTTSQRQSRIIQNENNVLVHIKGSA